MKCLVLILAACGGSAKPAAHPDDEEGVYAVPEPKHHGSADPLEKFSDDVREAILDVGGCVTKAELTIDHAVSFTVTVDREHRVVEVTSDGFGRADPCILEVLRGRVLPSCNEGMTRIMFPWSGPDRATPRDGS